MYLYMKVLPLILNTIKLPHKISHQMDNTIVLDKSRTKNIFMSSATVLMLCAKLLIALIPKFIANRPQGIRSPNFNHTLSTC